MGLCSVAILGQAETAQSLGKYQYIQSVQTVNNWASMVWTNL